MTAELECRQFGGSLPVPWWDQPLIRSGHPAPLRFWLMPLAWNSRAYRPSAGIVSICWRIPLEPTVARALVERVPERVGGVSICGGMWDLSTAVLRLGWHFVRSRGDADLEVACRLVAEQDSPQSYFVLFARVSALPGFLDCFWSPSARCPERR